MSCLLFNLYEKIMDYLFAELIVTIATIVLVAILVSLRRVSSIGKKRFIKVINFIVNAVTINCNYCLLYFKGFIITGSIFIVKKSRAIKFTITGKLALRYFKQLFQVSAAIITEVSAAIITEVIITESVVKVVTTVTIIKVRIIPIILVF